MPDRERTERLATELMLVVREHLTTGPYGRARVLEALNALGWVAATVIAGTGSDTARSESWAFFYETVTDNLDAILEGMRVIAFDEEGAHDLGNRTIADVHEDLKKALGE